MWCQPERRPHRPPLLPILLFLVGTLAAWQPAPAADDPPAEPAASPANPPPELIRRHNELAPRVKRLWEQGDDRATLSGLQELLTLLQELYPLDQFPDGHPYIVLCYRDLCRVTDSLKEYDLQWQYCQEGLAMCRRLFPRHKYPHGHPDLASMLANTGNALVRKCQYSKGRQFLLEAIEVHSLGAETHARDEHLKLLAKLHVNLATCLERQGLLPQAIEHSRLALSVSEQISETKSYVVRCFHVSNSRFLFGQLLRSAGQLSNAESHSRDALARRLELLFIDPTEEARCAVVDALVENGTVMYQMGNLSKASWYLNHALSETDELKSESVTCACRRLAVYIQLLLLAEAQNSDSELLHTQRLLEAELATIDRFIANPAIKTLIADAELALAASNVELAISSQAEVHLKRARELLESTVDLDCKEPRNSKMVLVSSYLGRCYQVKGEYGKALGEFVTALRDARSIFVSSDFPKGHPVLLIATENLATHLWLLGETNAAAALFSESVAMAELLYPLSEFPCGHHALIMAYLGWGNVLLREGEFDAAEEYLHRARDLAALSVCEPTRSCRKYELSLVWRSLGELKLSTHHFDSAEQYFNQALRTYTDSADLSSPDSGEERLVTAMALGGLGKALHGAGRLGQAESHHRSSLSVRRELCPPKAFPSGHPLIANSLADLGLVLEASGQHDAAFECFAESVEIEHDVVASSIVVDCERLLINIAARRLRSMSYLLDCWRHTDRPASEIYEYVWLRRGLVPRILTRNAALRGAAGLDAPAAHEEDRRTRQEMARALLVSATQDEIFATVRSWAGGRDSTQNDRQHDAIARMAEPMRELLTPQQLVDVLPSDAVMVDFVRYCTASSPVSQAEGDSAGFLAFVISHNQPIVCVDLGDSLAIERLVTQWRSALLEDREDPSGELLRQRVWDPVASRFPSNTQTVYVAPDGVLSLIPWNVLPATEKGQMLIDSLAIATVPHGPFLVEQLSRIEPVANRPERILLVGNVDYGYPLEPGDVSDLGVKQLTWLPLQASGVEIASVAAAVGDREKLVLAGLEATPEKVLDQLPRCGWAHFATHGFFIDDPLREVLHIDSETPEPELVRVNRSRSSPLNRNPFIRAGLALAGANHVGPVDELGVPHRVEGILTAEEIAGLDCRQLEVVVISACDSGCGDVVHGDGVFSVQTAFHVAGARNVIATLWKVDDRATVELMQEFYRLLWREQLPPLQALRQAQLLIMRHQSRTTTQERGPVLTSTVTLPNRTPQETAARLPIRKWAGFVLSGPGF